MVCFEITLKKPSGVAKFAVAVHWSCLWAATTKRIGQTCNSDIDSPCILQAAIFESLHLQFVKMGTQMTPLSKSTVNLRLSQKVKSFVRNWLWWISDDRHVPRARSIFYLFVLLWSFQGVTCLSFGLLKESIPPVINPLSIIRLRWELFAMNSWLRSRRSPAASARNGSPIAPGRRWRFHATLKSC